MTCSTETQCAIEDTPFVYVLPNEIPECPFGIYDRKRLWVVNCWLDNRSTLKMELMVQGNCDQHC